MYLILLYYFKFLDAGKYVECRVSVAIFDTFFSHSYVIHVMVGGLQNTSYVLVMIET